MNKHLLFGAVIGVLFAGQLASAQHLDVLVQVVDGKLVTGAANLDNNTATVGQQVFKRELDDNFRTLDPGFTGHETGNPLLEPGVLGLAPGIDLFLDIVPTTINGEEANFWWWDGIDAGGDGFSVDDVSFGLATSGVTWNLFFSVPGVNLDRRAADGSNLVVPGAFVQTTDGGDGSVHKHLIVQVLDDDGDIATSPPEGVYLAAMVLRAEGYEDSDPFFFVHRTDGLDMETRDMARDVAADWVTDNYAFLVGEALPGDFNGDGTVDAADYTVWRDGLGGEYDSGDYDTWRDNYGSTLPSSTGLATSVPEPAAAALLATLVVPAVAARRRRP